jgi:hypothetical protein
MRLLTISLAVLLAAGCRSTPTVEGELYGEPLTLSAYTPISDILAAPADYVGARVLVEGTVVDVCNNQGCWIEIEAGGGAIQVKVDDGVIVFPTSAKGKAAIVEGTVEERQLTGEQAFAAAAHRAEEQDMPFDSTRVFSDTTIYRIRGLGALIREQ